MITEGSKCQNYNHGSPNAPVRFCTMCGEVVNEAIRMRKCSEQEHATKRRQRTKYCMDCGEQLVQEYNEQCGSWPGVKHRQTLGGDLAPPSSANAPGLLLIVLRAFEDRLTHGHGQQPDVAWSAVGSTGRP